MIVALAALNSGTIEKKNTQFLSVKEWIDINFRYWGFYEISKVKGKKQYVISMAGEPVYKVYY